MDSIALSQSIPFRQKIFVAFAMVLVGLYFLESFRVISMFFLISALLVFFISYNLVITKAFNSYYQFTIFKISFFTINKNLFFPDYISLFNQSFIQTNHVGYMPDILGESKYKLYTLKFFKGSKNEILFISSNKSTVIKFGTDLANMLDVELHNTLK